MIYLRIGFTASRTIWLFSVMLIVFASASAQNDTIPFKILETEEDLSIEGILSSNRIFKNALDFGNSNPSKTYWIQLDFREYSKALKRNDTLYLHFLNFDFGTLYSEKNGKIQSYAFGYFDPEERRKNIIQSKNYFFPFHTKELFKNQFLYLEVRRVTTTDQIKYWRFQFVDKKEKQITGDYYTQNELTLLIPIFLFMGICLLMFVITLSSWFVLRKMEFLFHALFIASLAFFTAGFTLSLDTLWFYESPRIGHWFFEILQVVINVCYILFIIYYLDTKKNYPKVHFAFVVVLLLLGALLIIDGLLFF